MELHIEYSKSMFYFVISKDIEGKPPHETTNVSGDVANACKGIAREVGARELVGDSSNQKSRIIPFLPSMHHYDEESIKDLVAKIGSFSKPTSLRILMDVFVPLADGKLSCGCGAACVLESLNVFEANDVVEISPPNEGVRIHIIPVVNVGL